MLVQKIMEFINEFEKESLVNKTDRLLVQRIKDEFEKLDRNGALSKEQIRTLISTLSSRSKQLIDTLEDVTFRPNCKTNTLCFELFQQLSIKTKIPLIKLLIPVVEHTCDLMSLKPISLSRGQQDLVWLILSEDNTHCINLWSWFETRRKASTRAVYWDESVFLSYETNVQQNSNVFATYIALDKPVLRAFSLLELLRIRRKGSNPRVDYSFIDETSEPPERYKNFWEYLERRIMPQWLLTGKLLMHVIKPLLKLIDVYYSEREDATKKGFFREQLFVWSKMLLMHPVNDINHLYAYSIIVNGTPVYFINVLLDCLELEHLELHDHIQGLARFLSQYNASYISKREELSVLYEELQISNAFTLNKLKEDLAILNSNCPINVKEPMNSIRSFLNEKVSIDAFVLERLERLYLQYNNETQGRYHPDWLRLAQKLDHIFIKENYYALLRSRPIPSFEILHKIKKKYGSVYYCFLGETYENYAGFFAQYGAPGWEKFNEIPRPILPRLLELLDLYFCESITCFRDQLFAWANDLHDSSVCAVNDVHGLFIQSIQINNKPAYFLDVLLTLMYDDLLLVKEAIFSLANWLCQYDKSYIAQSNELLPVYKKVKLGPFFDKNQLVGMVTKLINGSSSVVAFQLQKLVNVIEERSTIDSEVINKIQSIYKYRGVKALNRTYFSYQQTDPNKDWLDLLAALSGAQLIPSNYYRFWMDVNETDLVTRIPITHYPLNHYLLFESPVGVLILLDNSAKQYLLNKREDEAALESNFLYNCNSERRVPLHPGEHQSVLSANIKFHKFFHLTQPPKCGADEPICLATLDALSELVNNSVYPRGTLFTVDYTPDEQRSAEKAYDIFCEFYNRMPHDEQERLNNQLIYFEGKYKSFKKLLSEINEYQCIAKAGQYILQLIVDYLPNRRFSPNIETEAIVPVLGTSQAHASVGIQKMRENSLRKIPRDALEFRRQACLLMLSLLTHKFELMFSREYSITLINYTNKVIFVANNLFFELLRIFNEGDFSQYAELIHSIVRPALADNGTFTKIRSEKNRRWLQSIEDGSFTKDRRLCRLLTKHHQEADSTTGSSMGRGSCFFQLRSSVADTPATSPQKAAPIPKRDNPDAEINTVMIAGSR
jgi:hypothetical protein